MKGVGTKSVRRPLFQRGGGDYIAAELTENLISNPSRRKEGEALVCIAS